MKKVFTLTLALMASFSLWAESESISWGITTNQLTLTPTITPSTDAHLSNASTTISLTTFGSTSSQKDGYCKPFYKTNVDFNENTNYASISFQVADDYSFTPSSLGMTVYSHGTGNLKYKVIISDSEGNSLTSNEIQPASAGEAAISFNDISSVSFEGTITIKLYAYNYSNTSTGKRTYIKSPISIAGDVTALVTKYNVTFDANGGSSEMSTLKYAENEEVTLPACTFIPPTGMEFDAWTSTDVTITNNKFTMPAKNVAIKATWKTHIIHNDATLSALSVEGCTLKETFDPDVEDYNITLASCYSAMPEVGDVTATKNDAFAEDPVVTIEGNVITIACEAEDGTQKTYTITVSTPAATELVSISESTTWDFTKTGASEIKFTASTQPTKSEEFNFADVLSNPDASFNAAALAGIQEYAVRDGKYCQGTQLKFNTTVPGDVVVVFSNTGGKRPYRYAEVNGTLSTEGSASSTEKDKTSQAISVSAGDVIIKFYIPDADDPQAGNDDVVGYSMCRVYKVTFTEAPKYAINCADAENGSVQANKATAYAGETITLTLAPADGYKVASVKVNDGEPLAVSENTATFTMPAEAANVVATFSVATALDNTEDEVKAVKVLRDGQLFIEKNGHVYNVFGTCVK